MEPADVVDVPQPGLSYFSGRRVVAEPAVWNLLIATQSRLAHESDRILLDEGPVRFWARLAGNIDDQERQPADVRTHCEFERVFLFSQFRCFDRDSISVGRAPVGKLLV
ncbi:hypothetical protein [Halorientalis persicus]|uniref:hypothetical protein n=1 Tax=Halorientalis persicus TaxID=1367881 RepID=UPI00147A5217|nr:hypothetical protein [Halorientalis persicus]